LVKGEPLLFKTSTEMTGVCRGSEGIFWEGQQLPVALEAGSSKTFDTLWLLNGRVAAMPTARTVYSSEKVKVAVVFEPERGMRPVWLEVLGVARVQVSEITARWSASKGSAQTINFEAWRTIFSVS
jgi:hypothetical protein